MVVVVIIVIVFGTKPGGTRTSEPVYKMRRSLSCSKSTRMFPSKIRFNSERSEKDLLSTQLIIKNIHQKNNLNCYNINNVTDEKKNVFLPGV